MKAELRESLDRTVTESLRPTTFVLSALYMLFTGTHVLLIPGQPGQILSCVAGASAFIFLAFHLLLLKGKVQPKWAHPCATIICLVVLTNILFHFQLCSDTRQTGNLLLLIVGVGLIFLSLPWLLLVIGICLVSWIFLSHLSSTEGQINFAFQLLSATTLALIGYATHVQTFSRLGEANQELKNLSLTDGLTGLRNRRGFDILAEQQFKIAKRQQDPLALLFIDLDNMKPINDKLGHNFGDRALIETATLLREVMRESDLASRLGGDEFCALICGGLDDATSIKNRIQSALSSRNQEDKHEFKLEMSIGIVIYDPQEHTCLAELLKAADQSMYEQKMHRKAKSS
jgi:diguanylate cyclase (GGDEF)-like protein